VKDSRPAEDGGAIRRRRVCPVCGGRFTTFERVQLRDLVVLKKSGRKVPFDRDKLLRSVEIALRKRNVDPERIDRAVTGIVRQLESSGESEVPSAGDRPAGNGGAEVARRRGLCPLRLGLPQFSRSQGFPRRAGELKGDEDAG
jgi:transcriptional repressor NrdR